MTGLILLLVFLLWWVMGGLYAYRVARSRNLQAQPGALSAALRGPIWVREMLIWSTLPSRDSQVTAASQGEGERTRAASTTPPARLGDSAGAVATVQSDYQASELSSRWKPTADSNAQIEEPTVPVAPQEIVRPEMPVEETSALQPVEPQIPDSIPVPEVVLETPASDSSAPLMPPPKKLPKQPKKKGTVKVMCPWCEKKQKYHSDAVCPSCHQENPWLIGAWGAKAAEDITIPTPAEEPPVAQPVFEEAVETAQILVPTGVSKPKRLPGKPVWGSTIKAPCPWCNAKKAYRKDAVCPDCHNLNPWLVEKWKLAAEPTAHIEAPELPALLPAVEQEATADILASPPLPVNEEGPHIQEIPPVDEQEVVLQPEIDTPHIHQVPEPEPELGDSKGCPGCGRTSLPDLYGQCMFCGTKIGEPS